MWTTEERKWEEGKERTTLLCVMSLKNWCGKGWPNGSHKFCFFFVWALEQFSTLSFLLFTNTRIIPPPTVLYPLFIHIHQVLFSHISSAHQSQLWLRHEKQTFR